MEAAFARELHRQDGRTEIAGCSGISLKTVIILWERSIILVLCELFFSVLSHVCLPVLKIERSVKLLWLFADCFQIFSRRAANFKMRIPVELAFPLRPVSTKLF